jgi:acetyl-CoA C-acetyltransferase
LLGRAGERQLKDPKFGLSHNLGGTPYNNVACLSIIGRYK